MWARQDNSPHWRCAALAVLLAANPATPAWAAETVTQRLSVPDGYTVSMFAEGLGQPRLMQLAENGDLLVTASRDGLVLLVRGDRDGDGKSDGVDVLLEGLNMPHGLLLEGRDVYVAESHRVTRHVFDGKTLQNPVVVLDGLPDDGGHSTRTLKRGPDGWLYLTVGSSCNSCIEDNPLRATLLRFRAGEKPEIFATGLRNTVGFDWNPGDGALYGVENSRDNLGDDVPDDEVNRITAQGHYGWPYEHGFAVPDPELASARPPGLALQRPVLGLGAHHAPLSIRFLRQSPGLKASALIAEHGSWNRAAKVGYRVVRVTFGASGAGKPEVESFLEGCHDGDDVYCRPVDVIEACDGTVFVSDDYGGAIFRIARPALTAGC